MIDNIVFLFSIHRPELLSSKYMSLMREVSAKGAWIRYVLLLLSFIFIPGISLFLIFTLLPHQLLDFAHLTFFKGNVPLAGYIFFSVFFGVGTFSFVMYSKLRKDIVPYTLAESILRRYNIQEGHITGFSTWVSFGHKYSKYERIYWELNSPLSLRGKTPFVRAANSFWLDYEDNVYIGVDPQNEYPPIFLGAQKPVPEILSKKPLSTVQEIYTAMDQHMKHSRRWQGKHLRKIWGLKNPHRH